MKSLFNGFFITCPRCNEKQARIQECEDDPLHRKELFCTYCNYKEMLKNINRKSK